MVLEELTARLPSPRLVAGQTYDYSRNSTFRAPASVLVEWDADTGAGTADRVAGDRAAGRAAAPA